MRLFVHHFDHIYGEAVSSASQPFSNQPPPHRFPALNNLWDQTVAVRGCEGVGGGVCTPGEQLCWLSAV